MNPEYDSVVCAALLHDVGKFLQRGHARTEPHARIAGQFVSENARSFADPDLVRLLVRHHHEGRNTSEADRPGAIGDERQRMLAYMVSAADSQSASERTEEPSGEGYQPLVAMDSVFSQVDLGSGTADTRQHRLSALFEGDVYPHPSGSDTRYEEEEYKEHYERFVSEFRALFPQPQERMADTLVYLLQKYLWCIPSDTTKASRDVSLADHMKVSGALAACAYRWHESQGWTEASVRDSRAAKSYLLSGDLSGIQNFIYEIANVGTGGVAKRLRGRSFRISMLTDAVAVRILHALDLPLACRIMSAGGQFYLLIPNTEDDIAKAQSTVRDISHWLLKTFNGAIALSTGGCELTGDDLSEKRFNDVLARVRAELALSKQRKFADVLGTDDVVLPLDYHGRQACAICRARPADVSSDEGVAECDDCRADKELGQRLVSEEAWLVLSEHSEKGSLPLFESPQWYATIVTDADRVPSMSPVVAFDLRGSKLLPGVPCGFQLHAGYVPRWKSAEDLDSQPNSLSDKKDLDPEAVKRGQAIKSFEALSAASEGVKLLGVLRADVDHLGLIFTLGMENRASLSRIATMSSMMHYFFTYELQRILSEEFPNTYTAYAGGDDLMLIGPWDRTIELSKRISDEFGRFTAGNPNITLSAGLGTYKPKSPIATASRQTGELLDRSKSAGRNRLTVFDTTLGWKSFEEAREWKDVLLQAIRGADAQKPLSKGFLYRLLEYQRQARSYQQGDEQAVMYRPHLAYNIGRNMTDKDGNPLVSEDLHWMLCHLIDPESGETWNILKAPITWCTYLLRKE